RQIAAAQDSGGYAERPGVPPPRSRPADDEEGRRGRGSVCQGRCGVAAHGLAGGTQALRSARAAGEEAVMNLNKFTEKAQEAVLASPQLASELNHAQVEPEHLLVSLLEQREGVVP